ncbi:hypothetical protein J122_1672 [Marinobacter excellens LAMA 842]|uniref:Uncharacterized protein n=1 Tax=Marinobacter excellens LAMA 842 TaxID=1306954 RepID=A0A137SDQ5_9GAMM|nr:hypothetical protein J122_1672 [Marinobacter excellens LAMA 842]
MVIVNRSTLILVKRMHVSQLFSGLFQLGVMDCQVMTMPVRDLAYRARRSY